MTCGTIGGNVYVRQMRPGDIGYKGPPDLKIPNPLDKLPKNMTSMFIGSIYNEKEHSSLLYEGSSRFKGKIKYGDNRRGGHRQE